MTALEYVVEHAIVTRIGVIVPDTESTPPRVEATLTWRYGRPQTIDRGEVAYWTIDDDATLTAVRAQAVSP